ncbi:MAG TPA: hypothetical protein VLA71_04555 [Algoriphagus sp.]|nr:hypothetical protein [Algoriphagus sp.]
MKKFLPFKLVQILGFALMLVFTFGCGDTEEPIQEVVKDSLYFKFSIDGVQYYSEIKESNLIPGSGNEVIDNSNPGMNFMMYDYYSNLIWMNYSAKCGSDPGRDCLAFRFFVPENLKVGTYSSIFTYGITVNGKEFVARYNGPDPNFNQIDLYLTMEIEKYDEVSNIVEGKVKGRFYKFQDPSAELFDLEGEFRVYIFKN